MTNSLYYFLYFIPNSGKVNTVFDSNYASIEKIRREIMQRGFNVNEIQHMTLPQKQIVGQLSVKYSQYVLSER